MTRDYSPRGSAAVLVVARVHVVVVVVVLVITFLKSAAVMSRLRAWWFVVRLIGASGLVDRGIGVRHLVKRWIVGFMCVALLRRAIGGGMEMLWIYIIEERRKNTGPLKWVAHLECSPCRR